MDLLGSVNDRAAWDRARAYGAVARGVQQADRGNVYAHFTMSFLGFAMIFFSLLVVLDYRAQRSVQTVRFTLSNKSLNERLVYGA